MNPLIQALKPITERVRTDVTAVRKPDGSSRWTSRELTDDVLAAHLDGTKPRGVCPIRAGESTTRLAVLDLDSHGGETTWEVMCATALQVADALLLVHGLHATAFRSSGGRGIHLYFLWDAPQDAYSVRMALRDGLAACGLRDSAAGVSRGAVEVFPKQDHVELDGYGNQVILPFAGKSERLVPEPLSGSLEGAGRTVPDVWPMSPPVPVRERPVRPVPTAEEIAAVLAAGDADGAGWREALNAIPNSGEDIAYEDWWRIIAAIHHETQGSPVGFGIALAWSQRSPKHLKEPDLLENRVWPYIRSDGRAALITGGTIKSYAARHHGWRPPLDAVVQKFDAVPDPDEGTDPEADRRLMPRAHALDRRSDAAREALKPVERRGIPPAKHLTTDLANANRLVAAYGTSVMVAAGKWYVWDGRVWREDEADVYRFACKLSTLVRAEVKAMEQRVGRAPKVDGDGDEGGGKDAGVFGAGKAASAIIEALRKWSAKCEMKGSIEAALGLARKMLTVDVKLLDANPWLLNCRNGVVDLRTGALMPHDAGLFLTKMVDLDYRADADSSLWERTLLEITRESQAGMEGRRGTADFLRRWFGYCATGDVREQVFVIHWGDGGNGKSTILGTVARVLGSYAGTVPAGMLTSNGGRGGDRHPTERADLLGRRMVTSHETGEGATLTDDTVKAITGGDTIKARFMGEDFFEFEPTHKVQLLTNSKPIIRGQDRGIWRRVCLVPYTVSFGTEAEIAEGRANTLGDKGRLLALSETAALEGVLAWLVRGAVEWHEGGLQPPTAVLEASEDYRRGQDRVLAFVRECCERGPDWSEPLTMGMTGLYPAYCGWCKDAGFHELSRPKFVAEIERAVPGVRVAEAHRKNGEGTRRKVTLVWGLRLLPE